jgi:xeroderma pigmentosum group C-complementing protein
MIFHSPPDECPVYKVPKQGVEIILNNGGEGSRKKQEKAVDLEAQMKRKLNRRRKEFQVHLHKVNLIAWILHGNFVNKRLNDSDLMAGALKLLPKNNNHCYPDGETDTDYFKQVTNWFKTTIKLNNANMYCSLKKRPPLMTSLALQLKFKAAICKRDYVLLFVILLRALGIQCRMVLSLNCAPILPPKSDLISLAKKPEEKSKSKSSQSSKAVKIPQLDGGDDLPRRKGIRLKGNPAYKVDESFVDLNKNDTLQSKPPDKPAKSRSKSVQSPATSTKIAKVSLDSPNRIKSPSEKLFKSKASKNVVKEPQNSPRKTRSRDKSVNGQKQAAKKDQPPAKSNALQVFSPRRLRSRSRSTEIPQTTSGDRKTVKEKPKNTLQVFSPRRLRSRSRSNELEASGKTTTPTSSAKPTLKNLAKNQDRKRASTSKENENSAKKSKLSGNKRKVEAPSEVKKKKAKISAEDSDDSSKYFKTSAKKVVTDRRVLSSDDEVDTATSASKPSAKTSNSKRIDIWVEVYSEKDKKWLSIDISKKKIDCVEDITKAATHPMVYVFAWNNDNSVKDISARYCPDLNTATRKLRVETDYLQSIIGKFAGQKTSRDIKEDDELNQLQLQVPMPTSIAL